MQERLLSRQGQPGWNRLFDLFQVELAARPADAHVNVKLVQLFCQDGRLDEAVKHCLAADKRGVLNHSLDWYRVVVRTLQVSINGRWCAVYLKSLKDHRFTFKTIMKNEWLVLQDYLTQPSVSGNEKMYRDLQKELLLAHCSLLRITLSESSIQPSLEALSR